MGTSSRAGGLRRPGRGQSGRVLKRRALKTARSLSVGRAQAGGRSPADSRRPRCRISRQFSRLFLDRRCACRPTVCPINSSFVNKLPERSAGGEAACPDVYATVAQSSRRQIVITIKQTSLQKEFGVVKTFDETKISERTVNAGDAYTDVTEDFRKSHRKRPSCVEFRRKRPFSLSVSLSRSLAPQPVRSVVASEANERRERNKYQF